MKKVKIAKVMIHDVTWAEALEEIERLIHTKEPRYLTSPNIDGIVRYHENPDYAAFCDDTALALVDGTPVLWAARFLGTPLREKISGSDLVPRICQWSQEKGYKVFFMGGRPGAADAAKKVLEQKYPGTRIVGTYCPPFGFEQDEHELKRMLEVVQTAQPDILFVGLGYPKQERWIAQYHKESGVPVSMGIGVSFEFIAGMVKRAPRWMQRAGLEWLWRLMMEPRRLWKRYLVDDLQFFPLVWKQKFNQL